MVTENTTPNRGYQEPAVGNTLEVDVGRLIAALRAIDTDVANALAAIVSKAGLASPVFTGTPTAPTAAPGTDSGQLATTAFVKAALVALVDSAPGALDTLNELAAAIGDDPNFAATMAALIGTKADAAATTAALALKADAATAATLTGTQTLTNKTLTSPVVNAPQGEFLRGHISGLTISNDTGGDVTNDIIIATGSAGSDGTTPVLMTLSAALTKRLDAAWAVGNNNGGWLDGASMPNGTGHAFLIQRSDTGVVDVGFSASLSPTLPTNYDRKAYIAPIVRASGAIRLFVQQDRNRFAWVTPALDFDVATPGTTAVLRALTVPTGIKVRAFGVLMMATGAAPGIHYTSPPDSSDQAPNANVSPLGSIYLPASGLGMVPFDIVTNTSGQIRSRHSTANADTVRASTAGFVLLR